MKYCVVLLLLLTFLTGASQPLPAARHVFIVTIDGVRWQEIFTGADPAIIRNPKYTADTSLAELLYLDAGVPASRRKLLPFLWTVVQQQGQLYGNRLYNNKVNVANAYKFSYPGYNELFTGYPDLYVSSNKKINNPNINIFEYLNTLDEFKDKVAAFTSWNIFSYILNKDRNRLPVFSGYDSLDEQHDPGMGILNKAQEDLVEKKGDTRPDILTFVAATEYIKVHKPKVVFIGFGECDEDAHGGRYDAYLQHLNEDDRMIQQLWYFIQSTPEYKNTTTLIITTDHGRGKKNTTWRNHDAFVRGSGDAWLAIIGPGTKPLGEMQAPQQLYQQQVAATIAALLGHYFTANHPVAGAIDFKEVH